MRCLPGNRVQTVWTESQGLLLQPVLRMPQPELGLANTGNIVFVVVGGGHHMFNVLPRYLLVKLSWWR